LEKAKEEGSNNIRKYIREIKKRDAYILDNEKKPVETKYRDMEE